MPCMGLVIFFYGLGRTGGDCWAYRLGLGLARLKCRYKVHGKFSAALGSGTRPSTAPM